ncbi:MAG TPA: FecR domain-containing protein [Daejeonella sp.]|uniref:FecR family protein n=1 Tax=Daejeonella sp. TaxID=2805397 RepID=UPI002ED7B6F5
MHSSNTRLSYLFNSYYNKTATKQEIEELLQLLDITSDDELAAVIREAWDGLQIEESLFNSDKSLEILNRILPAGAAVNSLEEEAFVNNGMGWPSIFSRSLAAAILIFISVGTYFWLRPVPEPKAKIVSNVFHDAPPGGNRATLTLSNGRVIILDSAQNGIIVKMANFEVNKTKDGQLVYHVVESNTQKPGFNTLSTPRGGQYQVVLPDGSKVWLNAASSIKFPSVFKGKIREVELKGEAYFEVAKNAAMPFKVKSAHAQIEVLGTHFNVRAYDDEKAMKTTLVEGAVKITSGNLTNVLKPGDQAVLNGENGMKVINDVDADLETAWKDGLFQFKDASIEEIMRQAALWYNLNISFEGKIPERYFTGKISRNVKASEFLNMLNYTGVKFRIEGGNIIVMN